MNSMKIPNLFLIILITCQKKYLIKTKKILKIIIQIKKICLLVLYQIKKKIFRSFFNIEFKNVNEENIFSLVNKRIISNLKQNFFINKNLNQFIEEQLYDYIVENYA